MNRLFDEAFRAFDVGTFGSQSMSWPSVEVNETDKEVKVVAELPGLEEKGRKRASTSLRRTDIAGGRAGVASLRKLAFAWGRRLPRNPVQLPPLRTGLFRSEYVQGAYAFALSYRSTNLQRHSGMSRCSSAQGRVSSRAISSDTSRDLLRQC